MAQSQKSTVPKEKKCSACGGKVSVKARFCTHCGQKLDAKTIHFPKVTESIQERQQKERAFARLKEFLDFSYNPSLEQMQETFELIDKFYFVSLVCM